MGDLTEALPKPMLPIGGNPMIDRAIRIGREVNVSKIVANVHYLADKITPHLAVMGVEAVLETPDILDTGGGLKAASKHLTSPTFTLNPDVLWRGPNPLAHLQFAWREDDEALLLVVPRSRALNRDGAGDFELQNDRLIRRGDFVYAGAQLIRTETVADENKPVFSLNETWDKVASHGKLRGVVYPGHWMDIGTAEGLALAQNFVEHGDV